MRGSKVTARGKPCRSSLLSEPVSHCREHVAGFPPRSKRRRSGGNTWHCNGHTFASRLVMAGVDLRTVAELLGHRTLQRVMRYSHLAPEHQASAVDRLVEAGNRRDTKSETKRSAAKAIKRMAVV